MIAKIKKNSFLSFCLQTIHRWNRSEASFRAAGLAFISILSLVPLFALSLAAFKFLGGFNQVLSRVEGFVVQYLVFGTHSFLIEKIQTAVDKLQIEDLGSFGLFFSVVACSGLFLQMDQAIRVIWGGAHQRNWLKMAFFYACLILGPLALAVSAGVFSNWILVHIDVFKDHWLFKRGTETLVLLIPSFVFLKWAPPAKVQWRNAALATLFTVVNLVIVKKLYIYSTSSLMDYSRIYGSLAVVPLFLIWVVLLWRVILLGFVFCAELENSTKC